MSFVASAIAGSAVIGAGASIYAGSQQKKASEKALTAQMDAIDRGIKTSDAGKSQALAYLDPFRQYGLNAGSSLQAALYSPDQQRQQQSDQRFQLQAEIDRLKSTLPTLEGTTVSPGKRYQTRKQTAYYQEKQRIEKQIAEAQSKLDSFDKYVQANPIGDVPHMQIEETPWYQFQAQLLGRNMDRFFAARGLTGSGFEAEERRTGLIQLGAQETDKQFDRLKSIYDVGANASTAGANVITGNATNVANLQVGQGTAQAQGYQGIAGANANTALGIANSVTGAVGAGLNYAQFQNLIAANQPTTRPTGIQPTGTVGGTDIYGTGRKQFMVNPPTY